MMYQFLGDAAGAAASTGGSIYSAAASTVSGTSFCAVESSAYSPASAVASSSGCSSKSCSSAISRLFCEVLQDPLDAARQQRIDHREIGGEGEHAENHDRRGALHLFAVRPSHAAHLQLQIVEIIPRVPNPNFDVGNSHKVFLSLALQLVAVFGRAGGIRTPTRGFGDRWSAVKPTPLCRTPIQEGTLNST